MRYKDHLLGRSSNNILKGKIEKGEKYEVVFLEENLSEERAFELEKYYIKKYGRLDKGEGLLYNLTDGGEGVSGFIYTDAEILRRYDNLRTVRVQNIITGEIKEWISLGAAARETGICVGGWWSLLEGKTQTLYKTWSLPGYKNTKYDDRRKEVVIYDNLSENYLKYKSRVECSKQLGINLIQVSGLMTGKYTHLKRRYTIEPEPYSVLQSLPVGNQHKTRKYFNKPISLIDNQNGEILHFESRKEAAEQLDVYQGDLSGLVRGRIKSIKKGRFTVAP
jgi:hypothetical protein